jgi:hypothetical protein
MTQLVQAGGESYSLMQDFRFYDRRQQKMEAKRDKKLAEGGGAPKRLIYTRGLCC